MQGYIKGNIMYERIYNEIRTICDNLGIDEQYKDDLIQEVILIVMEYDKEKIEQLYGSNQINFFLVRIIKNQFFSVNSPFYKQYRKFSSLSEEISWSNEDEEDGEWD